MNWWTDAPGALLKWPLVLALAGHAGVFALFQPQGRVATGVPEGGKSMQLRVVPVGDMPALQVPSAVVESAASPLQQAQPDPPVIQAAAAPVPETVPAAGAAPPAGLATSRDAEGELVGYLPRNMLTRSPVPLTSVEVPFPAGITGRVNLKVRFTLFIDELGTVRYVRIDSDDTPPVFADATRKTFMAARFTPAQLKEVAVRAQIRAEVVFETDPVVRP